MFPGQGSQKVGMGLRISEEVPQARAAFEAVDRALGIPLSRTCFEGPAAALRMTATTQPAILTTSIALFRALDCRMPQGWRNSIVCAAGHSLGEYSALVAAGVLGLEDAARTVRRRGEYMQEAVPAGEGAMAAVLGAPAPAVEALCREAAGGEVLSPANLNAPEQTVVAGTASAITRLSRLAKSHGVRRVLPLDVSAPFHCALMAPAQERLAEDLRGLALTDAAFPIITNVDARPETGTGPLRHALERQVTAPVRWAETIDRMREMGADHLLEIGPGTVLGGLARKIDPKLKVHSVEDPGSLETTLGALGLS